MAIVEENKESGEKIYKYQPPEWKMLYERVSLVLEALGLYVSVQPDLNINDILVNDSLLAEALVRIDKRKDYFMIFHDDTRMNEIKEAGLLAYWLLKFRPFSIKTENEELHRKYEKINEAFACFVIYSAIKEECNRTNNMKFSISKDYNRKVMYAFKYWDLSKEALMLVCESLCEAMYTRKANG